MTKFLALICILFGLAAATESCLYTAPLKAFYGFSEASLVMTTPKAYSDLKYCTSLASGACCTDTDINSISTFSDAYTKNLTTLVATRDTYITTVKSSVLPTLITNIQNFNTAAQKFITTFESEMSAALGGLDLSDIDMDMSDEFDETDFDETDFDETDFDESDEFDESDLGLDESDLEGLGEAMIIFSIVETFDTILNMTTKFLGEVDSIKSNYVNYQNARRTCVLDMIDVQNSAMCLSCDPNAGSKGFVDLAIDLDGSEDESELEDETEDESDEEEYDGVALVFGIDMSTATCSRLQASCKPYLALASGQNDLLEAVAASGAFTGLTTAMNSFSAGNIEVALTELDTAMSAVDTTIATPALVLGGLPDDCNTSGDCQWICEGLFVAGLVDPMGLLVGGEYDDGEDEDDEGLERRRLLAEKRRLDSGWAPAKGDSGVTVSFAADPGNTNTDSSKKFGSLSLGNVFVGMMVVISSILLF